MGVVMMAGLGQPYLSLKTQNLGSVFAERAVHRCLTTQYFIHTLNKRVLDLGVVSKVGGMQKLDVWMIVRDALTVLANPGDENARKKEIRENDDPLEAQTHQMPQSWLNQRKGDS